MHVSPLNKDHIQLEKSVLKNEVLGCIHKKIIFVRDAHKLSPAHTIYFLKSPL